MSRSIRIAIAALALVALAVPQIAERLRVALGTVRPGRSTRSGRFAPSWRNGGLVG